MSDSISFFRKPSFAESSAGPVAFCLGLGPMALLFVFAVFGPRLGLVDGMEIWLAVHAALFGFVSQFVTDWDPRMAAGLLLLLWPILLGLVLAATFYGGLKLRFWARHGYWH